MAEPSHYYGLIEDVIDAVDGNNFSRSHLLLDCVFAHRFDDGGNNALTEPSALSLVRAMSTTKKWHRVFGTTEFAKGDWVALTIDDDGNAPRAWELPASNGYTAGPSRSLRSITRLGDGSEPARADASASLAFRLASGSDSALPHSRNMPIENFVARLGSSGDASFEFIALDVGQASATLIRRNGRAIGLFDAGAPVWFNKGSIAPRFVPPAIPGGFIFLSHWDFDHFDLGRRHMPYRDLDWFAPVQPVGPNTAKFQTELGSKLTFVTGATSSAGFTFAQGTAPDPKDRNGSGYQLRYEKDGRALLLTGDSDYNCIRTQMLSGLTAVTIPHHAGRGTAPPLPQWPAARAVASYGVPNSYRHPDGRTLSEHRNRGWDVVSTAAGQLPRGQRTIFP